MAKKQISSFLELGVVGSLQKGVWELFWVIEMFFILMVVVVMQV